jgi:hypothetical protein
VSVRTTGPHGTLRQEIEIDGVVKTATEWLQDAFSLRRSVLDEGPHGNLARRRFYRVAEALDACGVATPDLDSRAWWRKRPERKWIDVLP